VKFGEWAYDGREQLTKIWKVMAGAGLELELELSRLLLAGNWRRYALYRTPSSYSSLCLNRFITKTEGRIWIRVKWGAARAALKAL